MPRVNNGSKTNASAIKAKERAAQAIQLRMEGLTFAKIADEAGYKSPQAAHDAVKRALDATIREPASELIKLELERLDVLWQIQYLNAQSGDVQALNACMKLMERRARLLGLDAPEKRELTGKDGSELIPTSGVLVVPASMDAEEWEKSVLNIQGH